MNARSASRKGLLALAIGLAVALASLGTALAHANLVRSDPAIGASLAAAPTRVQLWFSEEVEPSFSQATVLDSNRQRVDLGDSHVAPDDPRSLIVGVRPGLRSGIYVVAWTTQSKVDGHVVRGTVPFGIGTSVVAPDAANEGAPQGAVSGTPLEMAIRWLILLAAATLVGSFSFWMLQAKPVADLKSATGSSPPAAHRIGREQITAAWIALAVFIIGNLGLLVLQTATAADVSPIAALGAPVERVLISTQFGGIWIARIIVAILLGQILVARGRDGANERIWDRVAIGLGLALLGTITLTSHGASENLATPIGVMPIGAAVDWLHLIAVAVWVGGLAQLSIALVEFGKTGNAANRTRFLGELVPRFSLLAGTATAVIAATGLAEGLIHVGTIDNLLGTGYGQALGVKLILGVPLAALAATNHFVVRPALARARQTGAVGDVHRALDFASLLRSTVRFEFVLAVAIIAAVGVMTSLSPSQQIGVSVSPGPLTLQGMAGSLPVSFGLSPGRPGSNSYVVDVRDASGQSATNIERVALRFTFLDSDLGVSETVLQKIKDGRFEGASSDLAVAGRWQTEVVVRQTGQGDDRASFTYDVTPTGARVGGQPPIQLSFLFWAGLALGLGGIAAVGRGLWLRTWDLRRASVVAMCGVGLVGSGGYIAGRDVLQARDVAAVQLLAQSHPATPQSVANGAIIYRQNCATCHGVNARGNGPLAPTMNPRPADLIVHVPLHPDSDLYGWIAGGFPGSAMPAFKDKLTDQERWDVLNYLKSLTGGAAVATGGSPPPSSPTTVVLAQSGQATPTDVRSTATTPPAAVPSSQPSSASTPIDDGSVPRIVGDLKIGLKVTPRIFQPADVEVDLTRVDGQPVAGIERVDVQTAMTGMNHGARGVTTKPIGPGRYSATAMIFAMQGPWWVGVRIARQGGVVDSTVFKVDVPKDSSTGVVSEMAARPQGSPQIEDIAVYPGEVIPPNIAVVAGRPVRLEVFYVDNPECGPFIRVDNPPGEAPVGSDGLGELTFVPTATSRLQFSCSPAGLLLQPKATTATLTR